MPSENLNLSNFESVNQSAKSISAAESVSAQATVVLTSASGFIDESFVVIDPFTETAEIRQIDSISDQTLTLKTALAFTHPSGATVIQLFGNQLKLFKTDNLNGTQPDDDDFAAYPTTTPANPVAIVPDQSFTQVIDESGGSDYWYKVVYRNSVTTDETYLSLSVAVRGGDYGHYKSLEDIRDEAGFDSSDLVTGVQVNRARLMAES